MSENEKNPFESGKETYPWGQMTILEQMLVVASEAEVTPLVWGIHGIGKSAQVESLAKKTGRRLVDYRTSQIESVDMRGPFVTSTVDGKSISQYATPEELTFDKDEKAIIFLDELNRSSRDVRQAVFQLVYDRRIGNNQFDPQQVWVIGASNPSTASYEVDEFDMALMDRFVHIIMSPIDGSYQSEWSEYMNSVEGGSILSQFAISSDNIHGKIEEVSLQIYPTPRRYEMAAKILSTIDRLDAPAAVRMPLMTGILGHVAWINFNTYNPTLTPDIIIKSWPTDSKRIEKISKELTAGEVTALMMSVSSRILSYDKTSELNEKGSIQNAKYLMEYLGWSLDAHRDKASGAIASIFSHTPHPSAAIKMLIQRPDVGSALHKDKKGWIAWRAFGRMVKDSTHKPIEETLKRLEKKNG